MQRRITGEEIAKMRQLATMGELADERVVDPATLPDELELIHMTDVVEMQRLLALAADELERLYRSA